MDSIFSGYAIHMHVYWISRKNLADVTRKAWILFYLKQGLAMNSIIKEASYPFANLNENPAQASESDDTSRTGAIVWEAFKTWQHLSFSKEVSKSDSF